MAAFKDYYSTLGVSKTATKQEIRAAFRKLAAKHHPDKNPNDPGAEDRFKEVNEAYTVLSDSEKRAFYDQYGTTEGRPPFAGGGYQQVNPDDLGDFSDFFQSLFGGGFGSTGFGSTGFGSTGFGSTGFSGTFGRSQGGSVFPGDTRRAVPRNAEGSVAVGLEEAYHGASTTVRVGDGRIDVTLPKGARDGSRLRLRGQAPGGGDLYLTLRHEPHPHYTLEGDNIRVVVDVPDYAAALGGAVRVPTLDGDVEMTLPPGTQSGRTLRLRGRGWPRRDGSRGDELAEVRVVLPTALSDAHRRHYQALRDLSEPHAKEAAD